MHNDLRTNGYTEWTLVVPKQKVKTKPTSTNKGNTRPPSIGLPYVQGLSERLSKTFRQHSVSVYHKPVNTLSSILVHPKDKTPKKQEVWGHIRDNMRSGPCTRVRRWNQTPTWKKHFKETPTWPYQPVLVTTAMPPDLGFTRQHKSAKQRATVDQKKNAPSMNREQGYQLPPIYHQLLLPGQFPRRKTSRDQDF